MFTLISLQFYNERFKLIYVYGKMRKEKMNKDFIVLKYFRKGEQIDCY